MDCKITVLEEYRTSIVDCISGKVEINGKTFLFVLDRVRNQATLFPPKKGYKLCFECNETSILRKRYFITREENDYLLSYIPVAVKDVHLP